VRSVTKNVVAARSASNFRHIRAANAFSWSHVRDPTEKPLVDGLRRGDRATFGRVFERFRARVYAFALRLSGRRDVAEDLFQETFMKLARAAPTLREDTDLTAWLFTVVRNEHVSWRRWAMFDISRLVALGEEGSHAAFMVRADPHEAPDARAEAARSMSRLERALAELSAAHREVLLLVGVEGFDQEQAADILGVRYDAFRQRLARARAELAKRIEKLEKIDRKNAERVGKDAERARVPVDAHARTSKRAASERGAP